MKDKIIDYPILIFSDPYEVIGGGQLVLGRLLESIPPGTFSTVVLMPEKSWKQLSTDSSYSQVPDLKHLLLLVDSYNKAKITKHILYVSNSSRGLFQDMLTVAKLRKKKYRVKWISITHSYPQSQAKKIILRYLLSKCDVNVGVEPGLKKISQKIQVLSWLGPLSNLYQFEKQALPPSRIVKAYARADRVKGLHLLPEVFRKLTEEGFQCQVAISESIDGDKKYQKRLISELKPWLVTGRRNCEWLNPGDIFLVPSLAETTCLTAQEALMKKAFVISSAVGILPYLCPYFSSLFVVKTGDSGALTEGVLKLGTLNHDQAKIAAERTSKDLASRVDYFPSSFIDFLNTLT